MRTPSSAASAVAAVRDQLGDQGVVVGGHRLTGGEVRVDAHAARTAVERELEALQATRRGLEALLGVLGVDAHLDRVALEAHVLLSDGERMAGSHAQLLGHDVEAGDQLADGVLDLQARVHLHEHDAALARAQELDRARADVADLARRARGHGPELGALGDRQQRAGRLLDQLLVVALHRAVALEEVHGVAVAVAEHLHLDVASTLEVALEVERAAAEGRRRLLRGLGVAAAQLALVRAAAHAAPAAARVGLEDHRITDLGGRARGFVRRREQAQRARDHGHARGAHGGLGGGLAAHGRHHARRGADEGHAVLRAQRGEERILRQEAPARVQRAAALLHGGLHDRIRAQVARARGRGPQAHHAVERARPGGVAIGLRDHAVGRDPELARAGGDARDDLAAVGDQEALEHAGRRAPRRAGRARYPTRARSTSSPLQEHDQGDDHDRDRDHQQEVVVGRARAQVGERRAALLLGLAQSLAGLEAQLAARHGRAGAQARQLRRLALREPLACCGVQPVRPRARRGGQGQRGEREEGRGDAVDGACHGCSWVGGVLAGGIASSVKRRHSDQA
jgi:hypothetical protein